MNLLLKIGTEASLGESDSHLTSFFYYPQFYLYSTDYISVIIYYKNYILQLLRIKTQLRVPNDALDDLYDDDLNDALKQQTCNC